MFKNLCIRCSSRIFLVIDLFNDNNSVILNYFWKFEFLDYSTSSTRISSNTYVICGLNKYSCCCSVAWSCLALCHPMDCTMPGFPVLHCLLEFAQTHVHWISDAIQTSHLLLPPSSPALNLSKHQGLFQWVGSSYQVAKALTGAYQQINFPFSGPRTNSQVVFLSLRRTYTFILQGVVLRKLGCSVLIVTFCHNWPPQFDKITHNFTFAFTHRLK